jgi:4'-phosphopantetheinyl transferase
MDDPVPASWPASPATPALDADTVHVWRTKLDRPSHHVDGLFRNLSSDEVERAGRFRLAQHRDRYVVGRGVLRTLLGRYLNTRPGDLRFTYNDRGKPKLAGADLLFNVTHSGGIALFAVTRAAPVGIDVERVRTNVTDDRIAERFFAPEEVEALRALDPSARHEAFFRCWTRKEAFVKACGKGLSLALDRFVVSLSPDVAPALLETKDDPDEANEWSLHELRPGPGYVASLAVRCPEVELKCWRFEE